jgi:hypothetical protein
MKNVRLAVVLIFLLVLQIFLGYGLSINAQALSAPDVYVGVDIAYGDSVAEAKRQIDQVSAYTNVFIIGCKGITYNTTRLNETCQYIVDKGLNFIVYRDTTLRDSTWAEMAKEKWGDRFLGYYAYDEIGGWQIDMHEWRMVVEHPANYSDAANSFLTMEKYYLDRFARFRNTTQFNLYTSDYALYWFDYEAGYDTVFAEFGWNYSRQLNIAQCRGAANMHGKDWGTIITWTYTQPPYLESGEELYDDLVLAYENGAKYIILFDANEGWTQSVLKQEHFDALKRFWNYVKETPRQNIQDNTRVAYVLPKDYGYGFRGPDDKIWGFWEADNLTAKVCSDLSNLFTQYDKKLDIIYDDGLLLGNTYGYSKVLYWTDPSLSQSSLPTPSQIQAQTTTPVRVEKPPSPIDYAPVIAVGAVLAAVAVPAYLLRKRQYSITFGSTGIGRDYTGPVVEVDGENYDKYGASFWWDSGSRHTYGFKSKIVVSHGRQYVKCYVLSSTKDLISDQNGTLTVSRSLSLTGNYRPVYEIVRHS